MEIVFDTLLRVRLIQPIERIDLNAIHPDLPVQVRACGASSSPNQTDHLSGFDHIADIYVELRLVPEAAIYTPAMVDNCCVASYG